MQTVRGFQTMTDEQRLAALQARVEALDDKISAARIIKILENNQDKVFGVGAGNKPNRGWFGFWRERQKSEHVRPDMIENEYLSIDGNPPMELRIALAKVFREHYGITETQDDK
jgi:hypothetical protein